MPKERRRFPAIPQYDEMMWPTLEALRRLGNSGSIQEINDTVFEIMGFSDTQLRTLHGDGPQTEIGYRLHWSRTYLKAVGALNNTSRGIWAITERGSALSPTDITTIPAQVRAMSPRKTGADPKADELEQVKGSPSIKNDAETEQDGASPPAMFISTDHAQWSDYLLGELLNLPPGTFEKLCQRVLREAGFTRVEITGRSGDGGIDGIGVLRVALLSFHVFFQCKRYRGSVGASAIRDFRGAMVGRTDKGLFITTGTFTPDAKREATRDGAPVLDLIDGEALCDLLKDLKLGVTTRQVEEVMVDSSWFQAI